MVDPIMSPWDGAALKPIVEEAGGVFTDYEGRATIYSECAVVTNGQLHDEVMELVRRPE
jgi:fructose-1,6-bisphosphatase/inositol monophosphatase family enzyme